MEPVEWDQYNFTTVSALRKGDRKSELPYKMVHVTSSGTMPTLFGPDSVSGDNAFPATSNEHNGCYNKALAKVDEQLASISNLFESLYERKEAYAMIGTAGKEILRFVKNWRKPRYWRSLKTGVKKPENLPSAWLAYNFGVKPLIGSIDSAMHLLAADLPVHIVTGTSGSQGTYKWGRLPDRYDQQTSINAKWNLIVSIRAQVVPGSNPNKALANAVGLTTPFSTAWSVIPWGWAVDYFVNVSDLLSNFEVKHPGVTVQSIYVTDYVRASSVSQSLINYGDDVLVVFKSNTGYLVKVNRRPTSGNYKLHFNVPLFGTSKFANLFSAIALTMLGKKK